MSEFGSIEKALDIKAKKTEVITTPENGCTIRSENLLKVNPEEEIKKDYNYTRGNLYSLIEKGQEALNGVLELAQESDSARAYEVAGQMIKSVGDTTDKLIDLQQKMKELDEQPKGPTNVTNALFVGSTAELSKLIKAQKKDDK
tara:strand:- start:126 stop:557 length:432 start_codon:yes stop_codon:yes gene_type:complete